MNPMPSPLLSDALWPLCSTIFRARYSLLTLAAPVVLASFAMRRPRGTLYSLLLPRVYSSGGVIPLRPFKDLFWIAFASFCVATLAGSGVNVAATHGPERTPSYGAQSGHLGADGGVSFDGVDVIVWPCIPLWLAIGCAAVLPVTSVCIWHRERGGRSLSSLDVLAAGCIAGGGIAAAAVVLIVGVLRRSLFGPSDWMISATPYTRTI
jgi:hypothetical protein